MRPPCAHGLRPQAEITYLETVSIPDHRKGSDDAEVFERDQPGLNHPRPDLLEAQLFDSPKRKRHAAKSTCAPLGIHVDQPFAAKK